MPKPSKQVLVDGQATNCPIALKIGTYSSVSLGGTLQLDTRGVNKDGTASVVVQGVDKNMKLSDKLNFKDVHGNEFILQLLSMSHGVLVFDIK